MKSMFVKFLFFLSITCTIPSLYAYEQLILTAPDDSQVIIERDDYGVPHIKADNESALFFGEGFAVAQDRIIQLEIYRRTCTGTMSEIGLLLGRDYTNQDKNTLQNFYTAAERTDIYNNLSQEAKTFFQSYSDGINRFLDSMEANPTKYKDQIIAQFESIGMQLEHWKPEHSIAIAQYLIRQFGQFGGYELNNLYELQNYGQDLFDIINPINDTLAFTTIPPDITLIKKIETGTNYYNIKIDKKILDDIKLRKEELNKFKDELGIPKTFGSFAVLARNEKTGENCSMLLGCPQMGAPGIDDYSIVWEVELYCPTLHVGGMITPGLPGIIIGRTEDFCWTFTSGMSDNTDIFIDSTKDNSFSQYWYNGNWNDFTVINDTIKELTMSGYNYIPFTHYRTVHGPVTSQQLNDHYVYSEKMTFWNEELGMLSMLLKIYKAKDIQEFENALKLNTMSFNIFYTGKSNNIKFWHCGKYQDRKDGVDPRLPHKGDGTQEWQGFIHFDDLPQDANPAQNYYVNWNNKPVKWWNNGDNIPWTTTNHFGTVVLDIENYVNPASPFTFDNLKMVPREINDHGTYQQALKFTGDSVISENILPPGESYFTDINGNPDVHNTDQWDMFNNWQFKRMIFGQFPLSFNDNDNDSNNFTIYPNPINDKLIIKTNKTINSNYVNIEIYNLLGLKVLENDYKPEIDVSNLISGVYFLRIGNDYIKFIKL
ncbi:MAG: T9SS type A sorting domain-containing protein [Bacteroidetes bacterium]|nr:MAG: T9SS type A sorting domain-containing protein [Bacteroidota bacterium]